jgi:hypothetical protein
MMIWRQARWWAPFTQSIKTQNGYYIMWPFNDEVGPMAAAFQDWCAEEFAI